MEFVLKTDLEKTLPAVIDFNHEELKATIAEKVKFYNSLVVTEDSIKSAKSDKALLNKLRTAFEDKRKEIKAQCLKPYEEFAKKVDELTAMLDEPISAIDEQIKGFDDNKKTKKLAEITKFYSDNIGSLLEVLPLSKILPEKWANATVTYMSVTQEIIDKIITVQNDLRIIEAMKLDCEMQMKDSYLKNLNMSEALAEKTRFEEQQKKLEAIKSAPKVTPAAPIEAEIVKPEEVTTAVAEPQQVEILKDVKSIIYATNAEFRAEMRILIQKYGLKCEGIK